MNTILLQNKTTSFAWLAAWTLASAAAIVVGFMTTLPLIWSVSESVMNSIPRVIGQILGGAFFGVGLGLAVGLAQWLVLRMRGEKNTRWLVASIVGGLVGGIVAIWFSATFNDGGTNNVLTMVTFALLGGILGTAQFVLARAIAKNALWIAASALGLGIGAGIPFGADNLQIVGITLGGLIYGALTAAVLWRFSKQ